MKELMLKSLQVFLVLSFWVILVPLSLATAEEEKSADEIARELANPASALASLANNIEYREYTGDLPGAQDKESWAYSFQPVLPWNIGNLGDSSTRIIFRPLFSVPINPVGFDTDKGRMENDDIELSDTTFDLVFAGTNAKEGFLWGVGGAGTFPTGTGDPVQGDQWRVGPEVFGGIIRKWGLVGMLAANQFNVAGSNDEDYSAMSVQYFYAYGLGNGWQLAATPLVTADWHADSENTWSVPVGFGVAKTTLIGKLPIKFQFQVQKYVVQPDEFSSDWLTKFTITPVISNPFSF